MLLGFLRLPNLRLLPKSVTNTLDPTEYFDVQARDSQIILTPVHIQHADAVRAKLAELDLQEGGIAKAVAWARQPADMKKK